jgi:hypothetical protein
MLMRFIARRDEEDRTVLAKLTGGEIAEGAIETEAPPPVVTGRNHKRREH